jgi:HEAT repeat protein
MPFLGLFKPPDIAKLKAANDIKGLFEASNHRDSNVRQAAEQALVDAGQPVVETLIYALRHDDHVQTALRILDRVGYQPEADTVSGVYYFIAKQQWAKCTEIGVPAIEPLIDTLSRFERKGVDKKVGIAASLALAEIGPAAIEPIIRAVLSGRLKGGDTYATGLLARIGTPAIPRLISAYNDVSGNLDAMTSFGFALRLIGPPAIEPIKIAVENGTLKRDRAGIVLEAIARDAQAKEK